MCLVSYIPASEGYILSSNRDESPLRDATDLIDEYTKEDHIFFPKDTKGGSWVMVSQKHRVVCLLNGAYKNHVISPPYKQSRGLMMKHFFDYSTAVAFFEHYDLWNIEPFTMIIVEDQMLYEYRWDGSTKYVKRLDVHKIHVWSSCTLYTDQAQNKRAKILKSLLVSLDLSDLQSVKEAHIKIDEKDLYNGLYMDREGIIQTISHTQIKKTSESLQMHYYNLINNKLKIKTV